MEAAIEKRVQPIEEESVDVLKLRIAMLEDENMSLRQEMQEYDKLKRVFAQQGFELYKAQKENYARHKAFESLEPGMDYVMTETTVTPVTGVQDSMCIFDDVVAENNKSELFPQTVLLINVVKRYPEYKD